MSDDLLDHDSFIILGSQIPILYISSVRRRDTAIYGLFIVLLIVF
jgi:hypothetical protein